MSTNSMSRKGQELCLDQEINLVKGLGAPDFSASWMSMQVALGVCSCHVLCVWCDSSSMPSSLC